MSWSNCINTSSYVTCKNQLNKWSINHNYVLWYRDIVWNSSTIVPATLKINFRVRKKNFNPDKATVLFTTSSRKRFVSLLHNVDGTECNIWVGIFDSSLTRDANNETTNVRMITKTQENICSGFNVIFSSYFVEQIEYQISARTRSISCDNMSDILAYNWKNKTF